MVKKITLENLDDYIHLNRGEYEELFERLAWHGTPDDIMRALVNHVLNDDFVCEECG